MKKFKFFVSLVKERDWLEEMARQGWLFTNITWGVLYHFKKVEPCEKVFEVERFAITAHPSVAELTARTGALDITSQFGWKMVTHDEDMNYYFVKDRAGDETDEFYDDSESRKERAERYRKHLSIEQPKSLLLGLFALSILYILIFLALGRDSSTQYGLMWVYIILMTFEMAIISLSIIAGERTYREFCMSREEWERHKKLDEKKRFKKVQQLRSYLQEKSEFGLSLKGYENGTFLFEEDTQRYNYFIDTKGCLKKRLKEDGLEVNKESKDWQNQSLKWYEMSIANAAKYDLKPVAVIGKSVLVYKRPYSDKHLPWENGNENLNVVSTTKEGILFLVCCFLIGAVIGFTAAMLF